MNRFIAKIVFAGLLAAQFAPAAAFAQDRPVSAQITPVVMLRALFKAVSVATSARRLGPKDIVAEFARKKGVTDADFARLQEEAAAAIARDLRQALRSPSVTNMLRAEKDGMLGAAQIVSSAQFSAQVVTKPFAPKPAPAKRVSILDGIVAVAGAADVPSDAEIKAAEASAKAALDDVLDARSAGDAKIIAEERAALDKARAKVVELILKKSIAESVANCSFDPKSYYSDVKRNIVPRVIRALLTRVGELIGNPYNPENEQFQNFQPGQRGDISNLSDEQLEKMRDGTRSGEAGAMDMIEAQVILEIVRALRTFPFDAQQVTLRSLLKQTIREKHSILGSAILHDLEKQGILNMGGLADAIDDFLSIQKALLFEDIADLQKLLCGAKADIAKEVKKLESVLRATEGKLNEGKKIQRKLGDVADSAAEKAFNAALQAHLADCSSLESPNNLIALLKSQIYNKIYDAIQLAALDMVKGDLIKGVSDIDVPFLNAVGGDDVAVKWLQNAADAAVDAEPSGFVEGLFEGLTGSEALSRRLTLRLSILFLRELEDYSSNADKLLTSAFRKASVNFGKEWALVSDSPKILALQKLLFALDEFVRRVNDILAGKKMIGGEERLSATALKAEYCSAKARIKKREKEKEEALKKIEQKGKEVKVGVITAPARQRGACTNPGGVYCKDRGLFENGVPISGNRYSLCAEASSGELQGKELCGLEGAGMNFYEEPTNSSCKCTYFCVDAIRDNLPIGNGPNLYAQQDTGCASPGTWEQQ